MLARVKKRVRRVGRLMMYSHFLQLALRIWAPRTTMTQQGRSLRKKRNERIRSSRLFHKRSRKRVKHTVDRLIAVAVVVELSTTKL